MECYKMGVTDEGVRLTLRLPEQLRNSLLQSANNNHRSMNSEIIAKLESLQADPTASTDKLLDTLVANCSQISDDIISLLVDLTRKMHS